MTPEKIAAFKVDRTGWGVGPWDGEPDRLDFRHAGFACLALRNGRSGNWCGYVGVPSSHPDYKRNYNDVNVECHGGLTYGNVCDRIRQIRPRAHEPFSKVARHPAAGDGAMSRLDWILFVGAWALIPLAYLLKAWQDHQQRMSKIALQKRIAQICQSEARDERV